VKPSNPKAEPKTKKEKSTPEEKRLRLEKKEAKAEKAARRAEKDEKKAKREAKAGKEDKKDKAIAKDEPISDTVKVEMKAFADVDKFIEEHFKVDPLGGRDILEEFAEYVTGQTPERVELGKDSGNFFTGPWEAGKPHGLGKVEYSNSCTFTGEIDRGVPHGLGIFETPANVHTGRFGKGKAHGYGKMIWKDDDKSSHTGMFDEQKRHGMGLELAPGYIYVGPFVAGAKSGVGYQCTTQSNGEEQIYVGSFKNNDMSGFGFVTYPNDKTYEGELDLNRLHGRGRMDFGYNGRVYIGDFHDNKITGDGTMWYGDGRRYEGNFKDGVEHGEGWLHFNNGNKRQGKWIEGTRTHWDGEEIPSDNPDRLPEVQRPEGFEEADNKGLDGFILGQFAVDGGLTDLLGKEGLAPILEDYGRKGFKVDRKMKKLNKQVEKVEKEKRKKVEKLLKEADAAFDV